MKKLKIKSLYSIFIVIILGFTIIRFINGSNNSNYSLTKTSFKIKVIDYKIDGDKITIEGQAKENLIIYYYFKTEQEKQLVTKKLKLGDVLHINGTLNIPSNNNNLYAFNYRKFLLSKKIKRVLIANKITIVKHNNHIVYKIKNNIVKQIEKIDNNEYIYLFIMGKNRLDNEIKNSYSKNGISHLFAISGMHISLITIILDRLLNIFNKKRKINFIIISICLIFFLFLTNYMPSVIRASLMYLFIFIKKYWNLKISNLFILINLFILLLFINPYYIYNLGFLFSFTISFSLIYFNSIINNFNNYFSKLFITSTISFLTSIPILIYNFHEINFITIISNLVFVPYVSLIVFPIGILTFFLPFLKGILKYLVLILERSSIFISKINFLTFTFKHPSVFLIFVYIILIFLVIKSIRYKRIYLGFLITLLFFHHNINYLDKKAVLSIIYVGQGDSILLKLPYNKANILIDTGGKIEYPKENWQKKIYINDIATSTIIPYLKAEGIKKLDYLVLTHGDLDHLGEAINLVNHFPIKQVIMNSGNSNKSEKKLQKVLIHKKIDFKEKSQFELKIKNYKLQFLNDKDSSNENEDSLIIYTQIYNKNILLMGDAGITSENYIMNAYNLPQMDILKVGHHGSKNSSSEEFIEKINPKISLISAGLNNKFNHPHNEVLNILRKNKSKIYSSHKLGMIKLTIKENIHIQTSL